MNSLPFSSVSGYQQIGSFKKEVGYSKPTTNHEFELLALADVQINHNLVT